MTNRVIGAGITLPPPQATFPQGQIGLAYATGISGDPYTPGQNEITLAAGQSVQIPAGDWIVQTGNYSQLQYLDPVNSGSSPTQTSGVWRIVQSARGSLIQVRSDGNNYRIANLTGCAVAAVVTTVGTGYTSAPTVTASTGNSTWQAIIGGKLESLTVTALGSGYGVAPIVYIPAPPGPGVQATAIATISGGAINGFTITNQGAGYTTTPVVSILPSPFDPNQSSIVQAQVLAALTNTTGVNAVLCTNNGAPVATSMTLSFTGGGGSSAAASPVFLNSITAITATSIGTGSVTAAFLTTSGGVPTGNANTNPAVELTNFIPRQPLISFAIASGNLGAATIVDGGLFAATPTLGVITTGGVQNGTPGYVVNLANATGGGLGGVNDTVFLQPM